MKMEEAGSPGNWPVLGFFAAGSDWVFIDTESWGSPKSAIEKYTGQTEVILWAACINKKGPYSLNIWAPVRQFLDNYKTRLVCGL